MWYWLFKYALFTPGLRLVLWPKVIGKDNLPAHGGAVIAANHSSAWDTVILPACIPRRVTFPAKAELFTRTRNPVHNLVAWFLRSIGQVPVDRRGGRASVDALGTIHDTLAGGELVGIFPEGTRSPDDRLYQAKTGVARLLLTTDVPLIPVGLLGMRRRFPFRPTIIIGDPVSYSDLAQGTASHEVLRWVADDVMARIRDLTGQTYVDVYGASVKKGILTAEEIEAAVTDDPHDGAPRPLPTKE